MRAGIQESLKSCSPGGFQDLSRVFKIIRDVQGFQDFQYPEVLPASPPRKKKQYPPKKHDFQDFQNFKIFKQFQDYKMFNVFQNIFKTGVENPGGRTKGLSKDYQRLASVFKCFAESINDFQNICKPGLGNRGGWRTKGFSNDFQSCSIRCSNVSLKAPRNFNTFARLGLNI